MITEYVYTLLMSAIRAIMFGDFHNGVLDFVRIRHHTKEKSLLFTGSLHGDVAEIKDSRNDALHGRGNVLDTGEVEFADMAIEKPLLLDIHNALVGDNPDVEVVINPGEKTEKPYKNEESIFHKDEESLLAGTEYIRKKKEEYYKASDEKKRKKKNKKETRKDVEPVAMNDLDNLLAFTL